MQNDDTPNDTPKRQRRPRPVIEPAALDERDAAHFLAQSPRGFRVLIRRGDVRPIRIPGVRRVVFSTAELRTLLEAWAARRDAGVPADAADRDEQLAHV